MSKNEFTIRKVPLHSFIMLLNKLYMDGADYVDLHAENDIEGKQDNVTVSVPDDYLSGEAKEALRDATAENPGPPPPSVVEEIAEEGSLSEEEIEDLLNNYFTYGNEE